MITYNIKAGTTDVSVVIRIIDSTDGTPETGVVYNTSGIDLEYRREGATSTDITEATLAGLDAAHADGGFLHIGNGYYRLDLPDAACAAGANGVLVHGTVTGMVIIGCYIQLINLPVDVVAISGDSTAADNLESYCDGTTPIPANATQISGDATAADNCEAAFDGTGYVGGTIKPKVDVDTIKTQAVTCAAGVTVLASVGTAATSTAQTGDAYTRLGAPAGASIAADIAAIEAQTDDIGAAGAGLTAVPWNPAWDAEVQSEADDALVANNLDHLCKTATAAADMTAEVADNTVISRMLSNGDTSAFDPSTDGLQPFHDAIGTSTDLVDAMWDEASADHNTSGTMGNKLNSAASAGDPWSTALPGSYGSGTAGKIVGDNLNATVSSRSSHSAADVWAVATRTLTSFGTLVADIWAAATSGLTTVGSIGKRIVDYLTGDAFGRLGAPAGASVSADVAAVKSDTAAILVDTGTDGVVIPQAQADKVWSSAARTLTSFGTLVADMATAVWGAATRLLTAGTNIVLAKGTGVTGFTDLDAAGVRSAVGLAGANLDTQLDAIPTAAENKTALEAAGSHLALIKAKTDNLPSDPADQSAVEAAITAAVAPLATSAALATVDGNVDAILADTGTDGVVVAAGSKTGYSLAADQSAVTVGTVNALGATAKADVNAEVVDCLSTDTYAEPGQEAPASTASLVKKIGYLFKSLRNKTTQDATTLKLYDAAGTTVDQKATVSDDATTFTRGALGTGP